METHPLVQVNGVQINRTKGTRMARIFFAFIYCCVLIVMSIVLTGYWPKAIIQVHVPARFLEKVVPKFQNYFLDVQKLKNVGLVINTTNCQIPNFSPWDPSIMKRIHKPDSHADCEKNHSWTFLEGNELLLSKKNIKRDGYDHKKISCCYKIIQRVHQSRDNYNGSADRKNSYSACFPILQDITKIYDEFIMTECSWSKVEGEESTKPIYRGFHAVAHAGRSIRTHEKVRFWNKRSRSEDRPPNILIIGLDSTSRLNFRRHMNETRKILEEMEAVEMLGFTKVGENTFPNFCPIFFGYSEDDLKRICYFNTSTKFDDCPSIWKRFDDANYLTAHTEDAPHANAFNYLKTGFVDQPVDFYPRPLFLAAKKKHHGVDCVGSQTGDEAITTYIESAMDTAKDHQAPVFSFSWSTNLSHDDLNGIQLSDATYADLLERLEDKGILKNTILIIMGDHGYRWGSFRNSLIGYYEDKLPNMWIRLPPTVRERFPKWHDALKVNSRRLTSPFTLYWTLHLILSHFTTTKSPKSATDKKTEKKIYRDHRQNFFEIVPESNSCKDVGVPEAFCACFPISKVDLQDYILLEAALASISKINLNLTPECSRLKLDTITAGAVLNKTTTEEVHELRYVVGFMTSPGGFLFEAEVNYFPQNRSFSPDIVVQRASKINKADVKCIKDAKLELFCQCHS